MLDRTSWGMIKMTVAPSWRQAVWCNPCAGDLGTNYSRTNNDTMAEAIIACQPKSLQNTIYATKVVQVKTSKIIRHNDSLDHCFAAYCRGAKGNPEVDSAASFRGGACLKLISLSGSVAPLRVTAALPHAALFGLPIHRTSTADRSTFPIPAAHSTLSNGMTLRRGRARMRVIRSTGVAAFFYVTTQRGHAHGDEFL